MDWPLIDGRVAVTLCIINGMGLADSIWCDGVPETSGAVRVKDYAVSWVSRKSWRLSSPERVTLVLNSQVIPQFGDRDLRAVSASDVQAWVWEMSKTLAPSTVDGFVRVLVALMRSAAKDNLVGSASRRVAVHRHWWSGTQPQSVEPRSPIRCSLREYRRNKPRPSPPHRFLAHRQWLLRTRGRWNSTTPC